MAPCCQPPTRLRCPWRLVLLPMQAPPQLCCHRALSMPLRILLLMALLMVLPLLLMPSERGQRSDGHDPTTTQDEQTQGARPDETV